MFHRRRADRADLLVALLREQLDAHTRQMSVLNEALRALHSSVEARDRESQGLRLLLATQLDVLSDRLASERTDVATAMTAVKNLCEVLERSSELDRLERRRLAEALLELSREQGNAPPSARRVVGVTTMFEVGDRVLVEPEAIAGASNAIDFTDEPAHR